MLKILSGRGNLCPLHFYLGFNSMNYVARFIKISEKSLGFFWLSTGCEDSSSAYCPMDLLALMGRHGCAQPATTTG